MESMIDSRSNTTEDDYGAVIRELASRTHDLLNGRAKLDDSFDDERAAILRRIARLERTLEGSNHVDLALWLERLRDQVANTNETMIQNAKMNRSARRRREAATIA